MIINKNSPLGLLVIASFVISSVLAAPSVSKSEENNDVRGDISQLMDADGNLMGIINNNRRISDKSLKDEIDNELLSYEPMMNKIKYPEIEAYLADLQKAKNAESEVQLIPATKKETSPKSMVAMDQKKVAPAPSLPVMESTREQQDIISGSKPSSASREETIKLIAHNSREIRLVGADEKEVEMKDDAATRMAVAIDNLKKEAGEVWGQVNTKLDKGWTDFRSMVEDAVESAKKKSSAASKSSSSSSPSTTMDDIASAADSTVKTIKEQADVAGTKIKGFLNNLGINV